MKMVKIDKNVKITLFCNKWVKSKLEIVLLMRIPGNCTHLMNLDYRNIQALLV